MKSISGVTLVCGCLAAVTLAAYWPVRDHEFIHYDDPDYVTDNPHIRGGVTRSGVVWAFTKLHGDQTYWHPVTWLSHMLDCQWFGLNAGAHHVVNAAFHTANVILLFLFFYRLTGRVGRSALVAALFALHPLQVDSVAWVAERKNVLSTFFLLLTLGAYVKHAGGDKSPATERRGTLGLLVAGCRSPFYWLALLLFIVGLMCKPAVVTLPFVLLLLDYWPLSRSEFSWGQSQRAAWTRLLLEKAPFFALAAVVGVITVVAHQQLGSYASTEYIPLTARLGNATVSYGRYLRKVFWPNDLAVFYPWLAPWPIGKVLLTALPLLGISAWAVYVRKRHPAVIVGWGWFLGTLVPTIGLIQVGAQAMADRFAYVPLIGLFLMLVWAGAECGAKLPAGRVTLGIFTGITLVLCVLLTRQQLGFWKNTETLFQHAVQVTKDNFIAHNNYGWALLGRGKLDAAMEQFRAAIRAEPNFEMAYYNLGNALEIQGRRDEALEQYRKALQFKLRDPEVYINIADSMVAAKRFDEAVGLYEKALRLAPDRVTAHNNLALALILLGRFAEASAHIQQAMKLAPENPEVYNNLGNLYAEQGETEQAIAHYRKALKLDPNNARALFNLGNSQVLLGRTNEAMRSYATSARINPHYWEPCSRLAQLYVGLGELDRAIQCYSNVVRLETNQFVAWNDYGAALGRLGRLEEATNCFARALRLKPDFTNAQVNLSNALARLAGGRGEEASRQPESARVASAEAAVHYALARETYKRGNVRDAVEHLRAAVAHQPDWPEALNDAAWLLATTPEAAVRDGPEAVRLALRANELTRQSRPNMLGTLAAAYAATGRFAEAITTAERAVALAEKAGLHALADQTRARLELYRAGKPYREP